MLLKYWDFGIAYKKDKKLNGYEICRYVLKVNRSAHVETLLSELGHRPLHFKECKLKYQLNILQKESSASYNVCYLQMLTTARMIECQR